MARHFKPSGTFVILCVRILIRAVGQGSKLFIGTCFAMPYHTRPTRIVLTIGLAALLVCAVACGVSTGSPVTPANTYLYAGVTPVTVPLLQVPTGSVVEFKIQNDGTLTSQGTSSTGSVLPLTTAVSPNSQYYFALDAAFGISEFSIGSNGILSPAATPATTGTAIAFTPNGQSAVIVNPRNLTVSSYSVSSAGGLTPVSTLPADNVGGCVMVERSGRFVYLTDTVGNNFLEYAISAGGVLTPIGMVPTGGNESGGLVEAPNGYL